MRNEMRDEWLNSFTLYLENDIFTTIDTDTFIDRFQYIKNRRELL